MTIQETIEAVKPLLKPYDRQQAMTILTACAAYIIEDRISGPNQARINAWRGFDGVKEKTTGRNKRITVTRETTR